MTTGCKKLHGIYSFCFNESEKSNSGTCTSECFERQKKEATFHYHNSLPNTIKWLPPRVGFGRVECKLQRDCFQLTIGSKRHVQLHINKKCTWVNESSYFSPLYLKTKNYKSLDNFMCNVMNKKAEIEWYNKKN